MSECLFVIYGFILGFCMGAGIFYPDNNDNKNWQCIQWKQTTEHPVTEYCVQKTLTEGK